LLKNKKLGFVLVVFYLALVTWTVFRYTKQTYGVNDDVILQNWLSGFFTGRPEFMIRGSATPRISFGFIVSNLYDFFPSINWFSIILLLLTLFSWFILGVLAVGSNSYFVIAIYIIISTLHLTWFIPSPTYTSTAVVLSFSLIVFFSKRLQDKKLGSFDLVVVVFYVFSFFIRPESFLLGTVVASPMLAYSIARSHEFVIAKRKFLVGSISIVISLLALDILSENLYYKNNPEWREYKRWEQARYAIQANNPEEQLSTNPSEFGWTKAEYEVFKNYNAVDANNFNSEKLEKLINDTKSQQGIEPAIFIIESHQQIFDSDINWEWKNLIQLISFIFFLFLILSLRSFKSYLILSLSSLTILYLIMLYVAGFLRQPERVQVSVIFLAILISWASFILTNKDRKFEVKIDNFFVLSVILVVLVIGSTLPQLQYLKIKVAGASNVFWQKQRIYLSQFPNDSIFVGNASQFRNNWISPYKVENYDVENRILSFGWHNFSPHWKSKALGLDLNPENIFESVINDPRVYWVSDPESMEYIVEYMREKDYVFTNPKIAGEVEYVGNRYVVWDFDKDE
jgi:hypothetical protein